MSRDRRFYSDKYFIRTEEILLADGYNPEVLMQVFCRTPGVLCGMAEALEMLREVPHPLTLHALADGDRVQAWETVLTIAGPYAAFAHLETVFLGVLARATRVASQTREIVDVAGDRPVLFFGGRHDHYVTQETDGYAALVGGATSVATDAQGVRQGLSGVGTMPHALIAAYGGDTVLASQKFVAHMSPEIPFIALVDFDNDCVGTSLAVARALGDKLQGVRLDTSASLVDVSLTDVQPPQYGVTPALVERVRSALDAEGFNGVQIIISGGLSAERMRAFRDAPVDAYGVGSSILRNEGQYDFTADIVQVNGKPVSKVGRQLQPNGRLQLIS